MKIAVIGASGRAGREITKELSARGHQVTAIARNADKIAAAPGVTPLSVDAAKAPALTEALKGHDVVVSAVMFATSNPLVLIHSVKGSGVPRYVVVGGAGSLEVAPGVRLFETPHLPKEALPESIAGGLFLEQLRHEKDLDWTFISPAALFFEGPRQGSYRVGGDQLLKDADGKSTISFADFAIALVDEIEVPKHHRARFSVAY
ncbi:MAG: NAD(P)-dependent oxidoreductase [Pigmentiphaga sp.]